MPRLIKGARYNRDVCPPTHEEFENALWEISMRNISKNDPNGTESLHLMYWLIKEKNKQDERKHYNN
jgi:hypothetical protein